MSAEPDQLSSDLTNAWAAQLDDDGLWGTNAPAMNRVRNLLCISCFFSFFFFRVGGGCCVLDLGDEI